MSWVGWAVIGILGFNILFMIALWLICYCEGIMRRRRK